MERSVAALEQALVRILSRQAQSAA
jgi:hypothetical protein